MAWVATSRRDPVRPVVADDADDVAAAQAQFDQAEREVAHAALIVVPGEDAPEPEILFAQRDLVAVLLRVEAQQLRIGVGLGDARRRNPSCRALLRRRIVGIDQHLVLLAEIGALDVGIGQHGAGSPSAILRPKSSTMTRWEMSITTPMSCSIITTVMPNSSLRSTM